MKYATALYGGHPCGDFAQNPCSGGDYAGHIPYPHLSLTETAALGLTKSH